MNVQHRIMMSLRSLNCRSNIFRSRAERENEDKCPVGAILVIAMIRANTKFVPCVVPFYLVPTLLRGNEVRCLGRRKKEKIFNKLSSTRKTLCLCYFVPLSYIKTMLINGRTQRFAPTFDSTFDVGCSMFILFSINCPYPKKLCAFVPLCLSLSLCAFLLPKAIDTIVKVSQHVQKIT